MNDSNRRNAKEWADDLAAGRMSAEEGVHMLLKRIDDHKALNCFLLTTPERALEQARISDQRIKEGRARPLEGLSVAVKDMYCTRDVETTAASLMLKGFVPSYESTVTQNLWDAGAILIGKVNCDEFAMGSTNAFSAYGSAWNPWKRNDSTHSLTPGGSSGGSAAAVAAGLVPLSIGTDTGGSIRQPAAFCGVVGVKPTYGRCSRYGTIAFASSLDQAGPFALSVEDAAKLLQVMAGFDAKDSTSVDCPVPDYVSAVRAGRGGSGLSGLRVGIARDMLDEPLIDPEIRAAVERAAKLAAEAGATVHDVSIQFVQAGLAAYYVIAPAEASSNLARYDGVRYGHRSADAKSLDDLYMRSRGEGFGPEVRRRIMIGTYVLSAGYHDAYFLRALKVRRLIQEEFQRAFTEVDLVLAPTTPNVAFSPDDVKDQDNGSDYLNDLFTVPASLAGLPAMSQPVGLHSAGVPLGVQWIAPSFGEERMLAAAAALEAMLGSDAQPKPELVEKAA